MNKYISRVLRSIPLIAITILIFPFIILSMMGPVGNEPGGEANRKTELALFDWIIKIWTWAWTQ